jgi:hypothetical protein
VGAGRPSGRTPPALSVREDWQPELAAVGTWGDACRPLEKAAEECRILVANVPTDFVDGGISAFEPALELLDAQGLNVGDRCEPGRLRETALESARREAAAFCHLLDRVGNGIVIRQPILATEDRAVAVSAPFATASPELAETGR